MLHVNAWRNKICVVSVTFVIITTDSSRGEPVAEIVVNIRCLHVKCVLFESDFNQTCMLSTDYSNRPPNIKLMCPAGAELFQEDGRSNRLAGFTKLIDAFRSFAFTPKT